jgi:hypothetical protein
MPKAFQVSLAPRQLTQTINPWSWTFGDFSLFSINLGQSAAPGVESRVLAEVGSYGRQIGRIGDALKVLLAWAEAQPNGPSRNDPAIKALRLQLEHIDVIKREEGT